MKRKHASKPEFAVPGVSIRAKMIFSILIPVIFMIVIGMAAYSTAERGMREKYEASTMESVNMVSAHVELVSSFIRGETTKYAFDENLRKLTSGFYKDDLLARKYAIDAVGSGLMSSQSTNSFIENIHIITDPSDKMFSTKSNSIDGILPAYKDSMLADDSGKKIVNWIDSHPLVDEVFSLSPTESYILSYQMMGSSNKCIVVMDISKKAMQEFIDEVDLGSGSVIAMVTMNGREIYHESGTQNYPEGSVIFYGKDFYNKAVEAVAAGEAEGHSEVKIDGKDYLFFYSPCALSGSMICALVPIKTVTEQANSIKTLTIVLVLIATAVVMTIGMLISNSIRANVKRISGRLDEVAKGDLTVSVTAKGNDEFKGLAASASDMVVNTKNLVKKVDDATIQLESSSVNVKEATDALGDCSNDISYAVSDIAKGMERQSRHAEECVKTTDSLSEEIKNVAEMVEKVRVLIKETGDMIEEGVKLIKNLGNKADETTKVTEEVSICIDGLRAESENISNFAGVITDISSQTNLLSLNASIEAARAGDAGRGFAVVAEEIRKLADESAEAAGEIAKQVEKINVQTVNTVTNSARAQEIVNEQSGLVMEGVQVFNKMHERMEALTEGLEDIIEASRSADAMRSEAVGAVRNISDIIGETAENAETVMKAADRLKDSVANLDATANELSDSMADLKTEIEVFKI